MESLDILSNSESYFTAGLKEQIINVSQSLDQLHILLQAEIKRGVDSSKPARAEDQPSVVYITSSIQALTKVYTDLIAAVYSDETLHRKSVNDKADVKRYLQEFLKYGGTTKK